MNSKESYLWHNTVKEEMNSMSSNRIYDLVELSNGIKVMWCKWLFKAKKGSLCNLERYKARVVAKWFTQKERINYKKTFSHFLKKDSFCFIMALVTNFDLKLHQIYVKITFLNGNLEEKVYM